MSNAAIDHEAFPSETAGSTKLSFEQMYHKHWSELYLFAYNLLGDPELAKDVVQEVFIPLIGEEKRDTIQHVRAYLFQSVKYQIYTLVRNEKVRLKAFEQLDFSEQDNSTDELLRERELQQQFELSVSRLPDKCRKIFTLKQDGHTAKTIASLTGTSQRTVEHQLYIALKKLRCSLQNMISLLLIAGPLLLG